MHHSSATLPVPEVLTIGQTFGRWFAISRRHHGRFLEDVGIEESDVLEPTVVGLLSDLRAVPDTGAEAMPVATLARRGPDRSSRFSHRRVAPAPGRRSSGRTHLPSRRRAHPLAARRLPRSPPAGALRSPALQRARVAGRRRGLGGVLVEVRHLGRCDLRPRVVHLLGPLARGHRCAGPVGSGGSDPAAVRHGRCRCSPPRVRTPDRRKSSRLVRIPRRRRPTSPGRSGNSMSCSSAAPTPCNNRTSVRTWPPPRSSPDRPPSCCRR